MHSKSANVIGVPSSQTASGLMSNVTVIARHRPGASPPSGRRRRRRLGGGRRLGGASSPSPVSAVVVSGARRSRPTVRQSAVPRRRRRRHRTRRRRERDRPRAPRVACCASCSRDGPPHGMNGREVQRRQDPRETLGRVTVCIGASVGAHRPPRSTGARTYQFRIALRRNVCYGSFAASGRRLASAIGAALRLGDHGDTSTGRVSFTDDGRWLPDRQQGVALGAPLPAARRGRAPARRRATASCTAPAAR